jgi:ribosomal-protein-alanine N-acetyltransferase
MLGPRLDGQNSVSLVPPTREEFQLRLRWMVQPETDRFWGPRFGELTEEKLEERFKKTAEDKTQVEWTIAYRDEPVGFTGIFDIDWVRRDGESGIFIGRHDLFGHGIASEAIKLRTDFAWRELRLHRVHNWIAHANRGSRRANEKVGYKQMGLFVRSFFRSGEWYDDWLGEAYPHTFPDRR